MHPARVEPHEDAIPLAGEGPLEEQAKLHWDSRGRFDIEEGLCKGNASGRSEWTGGEECVEHRRSCEVLVGICNGENGYGV